MDRRGYNVARSKNKYTQKCRERPGKPPNHLTPYIQ